MTNLTFYNNKINTEVPFTFDDGRQIMALLSNEKEEHGNKLEFLTNFKVKPDMDELLLGFISYLKEHMINVPAIAGAIDVCGTGGDCRWHI
jgi:anthranilate phosphoribosyltransferase